MVFIEPLDINPVAKIVRLLTPKARTADEQPFRFKEIRTVKKYFDVDIHTFEFTSVPIAVLSGLIFSTSKNPLTFIGSKIDKFLYRIFPPIRYFYRYMVLVGTKRHGLPPTQ